MGTRRRAARAGSPSACALRAMSHPMLVSQSRSSRGVEPRPESENEPMTSRLAGLKAESRRSTPAAECTWYRTDTTGEQVAGAVLEHPQPQVEVLRALQPLTEAADGEDDVTAGDDAAGLPARSAAADR